MRKIITTTFISLDGVMQAPGGPDEDRDGGFSHGGWMFGYWDDAGSSTMDGFMRQPFELLLGRRTYDIFAAYCDLFGSMARTGVMFLISGIFLIVFGVYLEKKRRGLMKQIKAQPVKEGEP